MVDSRQPSLADNMERCATDGGPFREVVQSQLQGIRVWVKPERFVKAFIQWPNFGGQSSVAGKWAL